MSKIIDYKKIVNFKEKDKLIRQERKLLNKIKSWTIYKISIKLIFGIFDLNKKFLVLEGKSYKNVLGMISITSFYLLGKKIGYIDDFIVNKKSRGKGVGNKIFDSTIEKLDKEKNNYTFLVSRKDRKASHGLYKKFGFKIIGLGIGILAYKKFRKK